MNNPNSGQEITQTVVSAKGMIEIFSLQESFVLHA